MSGYTPLFASLTTGTLGGRWPDVGLWAIVLSLSDKHGTVDATPAHIARITGLGIDEVISCMKRFCEPDPGSRSREEGGARLVLIDSENRDWGWRIVNLGKYREKARKAAYDAKRTGSGLDAERKRSERAESRESRTRPDGIRDVPPSDSDANSNANSSSTGEQVRTGKPRSEKLRPSEAAIEQAMQGRCDIAREELVNDWLAWAMSQPGSFPLVDKAFVTWSRKHEPTKQQRDRAIQANRSSQRNKGAHAIAEMLRHRNGGAS
jgi:hypothetical protein